MQTASEQPAGNHSTNLEMERLNFQNTATKQAKAQTPNPKPLNPKTPNP